MQFIFYWMSCGGGGVGGDGKLLIGNLFNTTFRTCQVMPLPSDQM